MIEVGEKAYNFTLPSKERKEQEGKEVKLSDFKGKKVIIYFYPKDDTPGCTVQANSFSANLEEFAKYNCSIIGISKDSLESHCDFIKKFNLKITLLSDSEGEVCQKYGVERTIFAGKSIKRTTFLINEEGVVEKIWKDVKVEDHISEILEYLKANAPMMM